MKASLPVKTGDPAPVFCLPDQDERQVCLNHFAGKWVLLYFYPKDNTPGCTVEAVDFSSIKKDLEARNTVILGVSADSPQSHRSFIAKKELQITLLSDKEHTLMDALGVWQLKKNYGKEYCGIVRTTFLINPQGQIAYIWANVKAAGHALAVLQKITELQQ